MYQASVLNGEDTLYQANWDSSLEVCHRIKVANMRMIENGTGGGRSRRVKITEIFGMGTIFECKADYVAASN